MIGDEQEHNHGLTALGTAVCCQRGIRRTYINASDGLIASVSGSSCFFTFIARPNSSCFFPDAIACDDSSRASINFIASVDSSGAVVAWLDGSGAAFDTAGTFTAKQPVASVTGTERTNYPEYLC